jgi:hypothetical protein
VRAGVAASGRPAIAGHPTPDWATGAHGRCRRSCDGSVVTIGRLAGPRAQPAVWGQG